MNRSRPLVAVGVVAVLVLALAAALGGYAVTHAVRTRETTVPGAPPAATPPPAYRLAGAPPTDPAATGQPAPVPVPSPMAVSAALAGPVAAPALGARLRAEVQDVATGTVLYNHGGSAPAAPASTAKLLTAAALLTLRPVTGRITTRVVAGPGSSIVLVGAGDPTLTGAPAGQAGAYPSAARLSDLAAQLERAHVHPSGIVVDDALFAGPTISPAWAPEDVPSEYASAITAVMTDGGRASPGAEIRSAAPDLAAGHELAAALGHPGLPVTRGRAPVGAAALASVDSAPFGTLIEQMLQVSDNVIAECLARQVALAEHDPASFTGSARAIRTALSPLGVDPGPGLVDGSGLAARDRLAPRTLTGLLGVIAGTAHPRLHAVLAALPVAGWSGTLAERYRTGPDRAAAGLVRAKTGTLTGVAALAGLVHDRSGRLLAFALIADRTGPTPAAEGGLDAIVTRLATCGCS